MYIQLNWFCKIVLAANLKAIPISDHVWSETETFNFGLLDFLMSSLNHIYQFVLLESYSWKSNERDLRYIVAGVLLVTILTV